MPTRIFGTLRGTIVLPVHDEDGAARIAWAPHLRLPGLRAGEQVRRVVLARPTRAEVLGADGRLLAANPATAAIAGRPPSGSDRGTGLERLYDERLAGRPGAQLRFGDRVVATVKRRRGRSVHATIRPGLQRAAAAALGGKLGGVAVVRPRDGSVLALAGLAVSAPQPPGSTFKIITLSGALAAGVATPSSSFPVRTSATLSGVTLRNAGGESCGGSLTQAFIDSCNSVFAPLGAKLGATRLVRMAEAFGFNERPRVPDAKASTIPPAGKLNDSLAVGASAIGQDRDLATPLQMAVGGGDDRRARTPRAPAHRAQRQGAAPSRGQRPRGRTGARDDARGRALGHGDGRRDPGRPGRRARPAPPSCGPTRRTPRTPTPGSWPSLRPPSRRWPWP